MGRIALGRFYRAYLVALLGFVKAQALGALAGIDYVTLVSLRDGLVGAFEFAGATGNAFLCDDERHKRMTSGDYDEMAVRALAKTARSIATRRIVSNKEEASSAV
jgi:hypothetical protein